MSECEAREWIGYIIGAVAGVVCVVGPVVAGAGLWAMAKMSQIPLPEAGEDGCGNGAADECGGDGGSGPVGS